MDDYIKRKKVVGPINLNQPVKPTQQSIKIAEVTRQTDDLFSKLKYISQRSEVLKKILIEIHQKTLRCQNNTHQELLDRTQSQKSHLKTQVSNRNTSKTVEQLQQVKQLEGTSGMANQISAKPLRRQRTTSSNDQLPQQSKVNGRKRRPRQLF